MSWRGAACGLLLAASSAAAAGKDEKRSVPTYTNADLERVASRRGETGVLSEVREPSPPPPGSVGAAAESAHRARSEAYWRRQAERHRQRLRRVRERMEDLRGRIAQREALPPRKRAADGQLEAWRRLLAALEERLRDEEGRFADRARQGGALPGWLR